MKVDISNYLDEQPGFEKIKSSKPKNQKQRDKNNAVQTAKRNRQKQKDEAKSWDE